MEESTVICKKEKKKRFPLFCKIVYAVLLFCLAVYIICLFSSGFADFINKYVSAPIRAILAYITNLLPFSLAEYLLLLMPFILAGLIAYGVTKKCGSWREVFIYCGCVLSALAIVLSTFLLGFAPAYRGSTLDKKLAIDRRDVSAEELYDTAMLLSERINAEVSNIVYQNGGFSVMPYGIDEMNDKLISAYSSLCYEYSFVQRLDSRVKPVILSEPMSYTHITGVYTFFTGEANINVAFPDYTLPYTAAHELSHQRGIAREDEANFMAFLVCIRSDDAYIRYSGYLNLYEYVAAALSSADASLYRKVAATLPECVWEELSAYSDFFNKYRDSAASEVSEAVNNTFLVIHGTEGTKSYGMVVDLAVAYYKPR